MSIWDRHRRGRVYRSLTEARRWRRGIHAPKGKVAERVRELQRKTGATKQRELYDHGNSDDVEMQRRAHRESAMRHIERRQKRELEMATRPVDLPFALKADQAALF
jgi:hypothetical protein